MKAGWIVALALGLAAPAASQERSYEDDGNYRALVMSGEAMIFLGMCEEYFSRETADATLRNFVGEKPLEQLTESEKKTRQLPGSMYLEGRLFPFEDATEEQCARVLDSWKEESDALAKSLSGAR